MDGSKCFWWNANGKDEGGKSGEGWVAVFKSVEVAEEEEDDDDEELEYDDDE